MNHQLNICILKYSKMIFFFFFTLSCLWKIFPKLPELVTQYKNILQLFKNAFGS